MTSGLARYQGGSLTCDIHSLMEPRKCVDFQFAQIFLIIRMGVITFKPFTCLN